MFTGIIEETGIISGIKSVGEGITLEIAAVKVLEGTNTGDSIAVDGVCLTVESLSKEHFTVFASRVSLSITTLVKRRKGEHVNLERALLPGSRMGGHFVQGHVDGTGNIGRIKKDSNGVEIVVHAPAEIIKYIVPRGSVAVDGISLTAVAVSQDAFTLYLIPETVSNTTLTEKKTGEPVNIEVDILGKYVERFFERRWDKGGTKNNGALLKKLAEEGYL